VCPSWLACDADDAANSNRLCRDAGISVSRREEIARPVRKHGHSPGCWHRQTRRAAIYLSHNPGEVRRLLGHKNVQTTIRFYCALETAEATRKFGAIVRNLLKFEPEDV
jgi:hypothetical protein